MQTKGVWRIVGQVGTPGRHYGVNRCAFIANVSSGEVTAKERVRVALSPGLPTCISHCCKSVVVLKRSRIVNCFCLKLLFDIHARRASSGHCSVHFAAL